MKEILDLIHELRCDINYCKVSGENETEIKDANETLIKLQELVKNLNISDVSNCYMADCLTQDSCFRFKQQGCNKDCKLYM